MDHNQQDNFRTLLTEAIIKLCQSEAVYTSELRIEGTVCVVSDGAAIMIAHFSECVGNSYSLASERNGNLEIGFEPLVDGLSMVDQTELMLPEVKIEPDEFIRTFEEISEDGDILSVMPGFCQAAEKSVLANNNNNVADDVKPVGGQHQCPQCQKMFQLKRTLQSHVRTHHGQQLHACHHCSATFVTRAILRMHIKKEHCDLRKRRQSGKKPSVRSGMQHHADNNGAVPQTPEQAAVDAHDTCLNGNVCTPKDETTPDCMEADGAADGAVSLALLEALEGKDWEKMVENTQLLANSISTAGYHTPLQPSESYKSTTPGTPCSNVVKAKVMECFEKVNIETPHGLCKFKCCLCQKMFKLRTSLYEHINSHTGNRRYSCDTCGDRFVHHSSLHNHINSKHVLQRQDLLRYLCTGCDRRFKFRSQYERHLRSYPGHCVKTSDAQ